MDLKIHSLKLWPRLLIAALAGASMSLCFAPTAIPIAPFVLTVLILQLQGVSVKHASYIGFCFGMLFFGVSLRWLGSMFGTPAITLWALSALFPMAACAAFVYISSYLRRLSWARILIFPICWTGTEYFRSERMLPDFTWMGLGYSTTGYPIFSAVASTIGCYGVTLCICMFAALLAAAAQRALITRDMPARAQALFGIAGLFTLWFGACTTLGQGQDKHWQPVEGIHVRLVQAPSEQDSDYLQLSREKTGFVPQVIVWPEDSFVSDPHTTLKLWPKLQGLASELNCWLLFGARDVTDASDPNGFKKAAYLLNPQGDLVGKHFKNHLVHFFREGIAGTEAHAIQTPFARIGIAICFDMDFPDVARREVAEGAELLLCPSDNPAEWGALQHVQHRQLFQMRAAECGRWVAMADTAGGTFLVDPTGKIQSALPAGLDIGKLDVIVPKISGKTLFVMGGWRTGQVALALLVILILFAVHASKREAASASEQIVD